MKKAVLVKQLKDKEDEIQKLYDDNQNLVNELVNLQKELKDIQKEEDNLPEEHKGVKKAVLLKKLKDQEDEIKKLENVNESTDDLNT